MEVLEIIRPMMEEKLAKIRGEYEPQPKGENEPCPISGRTGGTFDIWTAGNFTTRADDA